MATTSAASFAGNFNPRSPHGERPQSVRCSLRATNFNPRSPHGERRVSRRAPTSSAIFQSTLPARGATTKSSATGRCEAFQSTLPARGATTPRKTLLQTRYFNPRSPHGERRLRQYRAQNRQRISIHAPRTGSDKMIFAGMCLAIFQSTLPARGATGSHQAAESQQDDFNPRSPHGERQIPVYNARREAVFQSTLPARGATLLVPPDTRRAPISIHAPRTGSDAPNTIRSHLPYTFQSTLPARGATPLR